jgi:2'-5' RNA ligase
VGGHSAPAARLFLAITPPEPARAHLGAATALLHGPELRWIPTERLHVTVVFYGDVPLAHLDELEDRIGRAVARARLPAPPRVRLAGAGRFGRRVLHVGLAGDVAGLPRLASLAAAAGRRVGVPVDDRSFTGHVTVARARGTRADLRPYVEALASYEGPWWQAREVTLLRSWTGPAPSYEPLAHWSLGAAAAGPDAVGDGD